jgi:RND superfamily putative drug exporter
VGLWVVAVIAVAFTASEAGQDTNDDLTLPGTGSTEANDLLDRHLPKENGANPIVLESTSGKLTQGENKKAVKETVASLRRSPDVERAISPLSAKGADALSADERIAYISLTLRDGPEDLDEATAEDVFAGADPAREAGLEVSAGAYLGQELSLPSTRLSEVVGIVAALIILLFTFGTAVAMGMPIMTAIVALIASLSVIGLLGHAIDVPTVAPSLATMIGLGVGIDYSLFIVTRYRKRLSEGLDVNEAIARSCATSGSAVAFAGGTVIIALCSLSFAGIPLVSTLGYTAAVAVVTAVLAALTLLPAVLAMLGHRIDSLKIPALHARAQDDKAHGWERWARGVGKRTIPALVLAIVILVVLALPVLDIRLGQEDIGEYPESTTARQAYDGLTKGFGVGANSPFLVAVRFDPKAHNDRKSLTQLEAKEKRDQQKQEEEAQSITEQLVAEGVPEDQATQEAEAEVAPSAKKQQKLDQEKKFLESDASDPDLVHLENQISKTTGVKSVSEATVDKSGTAAVFTVIPRYSPSSEANSNLVVDLRDDVIPPATDGREMTAYVGGTTAGYIDLADRISEKLPSVILIVVALSFVLLTLAFRSILVPLTAALMNLLSVAAAYGVLTAVFEKGWGVELIGISHPIPVVSFVPLLMFAILFGLSMDYQVFLVSRIDERYREFGEDNHEAVVQGLASSARVITSAALIMVCVFLSFVLSGDPTVKQFGVGMAVAIAVDATIIRCLLVPSAMIQIGKANWWLPRWLDRILPRVGLETEDDLPPLPEPAAGTARTAETGKAV